MSGTWFLPSDVLPEDQACQANSAKVLVTAVQMQRLIAERIAAPSAASAKPSRTRMDGWLCAKADSEPLAVPVSQLGPAPKFSGIPPRKTLAFFPFFPCITPTYKSRDEQKKRYGSHPSQF